VKELWQALFGPIGALLLLAGGAGLIPVLVSLQKPPEAGFVTSLITIPAESQPTSGAQPV
jgi:hypothetical protein